VIIISGANTPWCVPFELLIKHNNGINGFRKKDKKIINKKFKKYYKYMNGSYIKTSK